MAIGDHNFLHLGAIFLAGITFNITILFTSGAMGHKLGLFVNSTKSLAEKYMLGKYELDVTPADFVFYMAALIYFWQSIWLTYGLSLVCRKAGGGYMYVTFPVLPPDLYVVFAFALACNISWLLIWDREYMEVALVFINLMSCTLYICLVVSLRRLNEFGQAMMSQNLGRDIWYIRIFVQNGLAMFASWGTVAAIFNFAVVLSYGTGAKKEVASTVSLTIYVLEIFGWFAFDNFLFDKYLRYLFTPYIVIVVSVAGILIKNWNPDKANCIYTLIIFLMVCVLIIFKVIILIYRHRKQPVFITRTRATGTRYRQPIVSFEVTNLLET